MIYHLFHADYSPLRQQFEMNFGGVNWAVEYLKTDYALVLPPKMQDSKNIILVVCYNWQQEPVLTNSLGQIILVTYNIIILLEVIYIRLDEKTNTKT